MPQPSHPRPPPSEPTVATTVAALRRSGFTKSYGVRGDQIQDEETDQLLPPTDFAIEELYRFEGDTDPADQAIVVALEHLSSRAHGIIVAAYGPTASAEENAVLRQFQDRRSRTHG